MEALFAALEQAFADYRTDLENYEKKSKPTDGLLGFGHSLRDDACHERLDERIERTVAGIREAKPDPNQAERAVRLLLYQGKRTDWPLAAQWMLRAVERHALPLIPFLSKDDASAFLQDYTSRYRPWDRLPAQKQVYKALKAQSREK